MIHLPPTTADKPAQASSGAEDSALILPASGLPLVPRHPVQAIRDGSFVELGELLPEVLREAQFDKARDKDETKGKGKKYFTNTPVDWMAAFAIFTAIAVHFKPQRAFDLAVYTSIIMNLARESRGSAWSRYDRVFRQAAAVNPGLPWNRREQDIWLTSAMEPSSIPATRPATQRGQPPSQRLPDICRNWNKGSCTMPQCRFRHACFVCSGSGHVTKECPLLATSSSNHPSK